MTIKLRIITTVSDDSRDSLYIRGMRQHCVVIFSTAGSQTTKDSLSWVKQMVVNVFCSNRYFDRFIPKSELKGLKNNIFLLSGHQSVILESINLTFRLQVL